MPILELRIWVTGDCMTHERGAALEERVRAWAAAWGFYGDNVNITRGLTTERRAYECESEE